MILLAWQSNKISTDFPCSFGTTRLPVNSLSRITRLWTFDIILENQAWRTRVVSPSFPLLLSIKQSWLYALLSSKKFIRIESLLGGLRRRVEAPFVALLSSTTIGPLVSSYWLQLNFHQKLSRETSQAATTGGRARYCWLFPAACLSALLSRIWSVPRTMLLYWEILPY